MKRIDIGKFIASIAVSLSAGFLGSVFTSESVQTWYPTIAKPAWNPPAWLFAPVWTILFILMGIALYLVWVSKPRRTRASAIEMYFFQLVINVAWSLVFFGLQSPGYAFLVIVILWLLILETIRRFSKVNRISAVLLYPYIAWVSFAAVLNLVITILNK